MPILSDAMGIAVGGGPVSTILAEISSVCSIAAPIGFTLIGIGIAWKYVRLMTGADGDFNVSDSSYQFAVDSALDDRTLDGSYLLSQDESEIYQNHLQEMELKGLDQTTEGDSWVGNDADDPFWGSLHSDPNPMETGDPKNLGDHKWHNGGRS
jgi:hypothetical protein